MSDGTFSFDTDISDDVVRTALNILDADGYEEKNVSDAEHAAELELSQIQNDIVIECLFFFLFFFSNHNIYI